MAITTQHLPGKLHRAEAARVLLVFTEEAPCATDNKSAGVSVLSGLLKAQGSQLATGLGISEMPLPAS